MRNTIIIARGDRMKTKCVMEEFLKEITRKTCINFKEVKENLDKLSDNLDECEKILDDLIETFSAPDLPQDFVNALKDLRRKLNDVRSDVASLHVAFHVFYIAWAIKRSKK